MHKHRVRIGRTVGLSLVPVLASKKFRVKAFVSLRFPLAHTRRDE